MSRLTPHVRKILDALDRVTIDPKVLKASVVGDTYSYDIGLASCRDYENACQALKAKPDRGSVAVRGSMQMRSRITLAGELIITHHCYPHLPCWETT